MDAGGGCSAASTTKSIALRASRAIRASLRFITDYRATSGESSEACVLKLPVGNRPSNSSDPHCEADIITLRSNYQRALSSPPILRARATEVGFDGTESGAILDDLERMRPDEYVQPFVGSAALALSVPDR